ncbi:hypothetical protein Q7P37_005224 [Cladosporium fusiforme]
MMKFKSKSSPRPKTPPNPRPTLQSATPSKLPDHIADTSNDNVALSSPSQPSRNNSKEPAPTMAALSLPPAIASPQHRTPARTPMHGPQNVDNVVLGNLRIAPEYPSFYPEDLIGGRKVPWLYKVCAAEKEPIIGDVVYEKDGYAIQKIDGDEHKLFAQNLSLFAKLFLDTKSVFFDVSSFLYYLLIQLPSPQPEQLNGDAPPALPSQPQIVGFYSKEKMSWDNNNLACILVFPPWQRKGLGQLLIGASARGLKGYVAYWCREVARYIVEAPGKKTVSVKSISDATWIMPEDVVMALQEMGCLEDRKTASGSLVVNKARVREWAEKKKATLEPVVDVDAFIEEESEETDEDEASESEDAEAGA